MKSLLRLLPVFVLLSVAGCGRQSEGTGSTPGARSYTIAVIPKGTTHEFWKSIHAGAVKAERELNEKGVKTEIIWKGPLKEDDRDQQIQVVENFMSRRVSGIVLAPLDSQALVKPVENAIQAKVPVVIIDSDVKSDQYVSFVATDNYKGGRLAGERLGQLLAGKGNVILLRYAVGSASTEAREIGFLDALKSKYPEIKLISSDQRSGPTRETAYQASQNLLNRFGNEVDGIFCPCEPPTIAMTKALRDIGKAGGKVKMVGFDSGSQSVLGPLTIDSVIVDRGGKVNRQELKLVVPAGQTREFRINADETVEVVTP